MMVMKKIQLDKVLWNVRSSDDHFLDLHLQDTRRGGRT